MKRPSFQFYPADWRKDANLRRCSPAARGVWMDILCVLHDSDEYGIVRWPLKELCSAAGASAALVRELVEKRVIKGCDKGACEPLVYVPRSGRKAGPAVELIHSQEGPIWFSARFVRDEYVRTIRGESSRFGEGNDAAPKASPKPPIGDGPTSSSSSSTSVVSEANASGGQPPKTLDQEKKELYDAGKSLLQLRGTPKEQCGSFIAKLAKDYGQDAALQAVRSAVAAQPLNAIEYLKAACMRLTGERKDPPTVEASESTAEYVARMAAEREAEKLTPEQVAAAEAARVAVMSKRRRVTSQEVA
jgi:hypothetical protein